MFLGLQEQMSLCHKTVQYSWKMVCQYGYMTYLGALGLQTWGQKIVEFWRVKPRKGGVWRKVWLQQSETVIFSRGSELCSLELFKISFLVKRILVRQLSLMVLGWRNAVFCGEGFRRHVVILVPHSLLLLNRCYLGATQIEVHSASASVWTHRKTDNPNELLR